jgi:hypothetical protein
MRSIADFRSSLAALESSPAVRLKVSFKAELAAFISSNALSRALVKAASTTSRVVIPVLMVKEVGGRAGMRLLFGSYPSRL